MAFEFLETLSTPSVKAEQAANGGEQYWGKFSGDPEPLYFHRIELSDPIDGSEGL